jgi:sugar diacid utilization regulator
MFGRRGENHPAFGMKHSAEAIKNTAEKQRGRLSYQYISDILAKNMETGEEIVAESAKEMALKLSVSKKTILNRLNNKSKSFTSSLIKNIWRISRVLS